MTNRCTTPLAALVGLLVAYAPAEAQAFAIDRGSLLIDGQASFTSTGQEVNGVERDDRFTTLSISPGVQYFVTRGLALGGDVLVARSSLGDDGFWTYGIGPAATYFFGAAERTWYPYLGASLSFIKQSSDDDDDTSTFGYRGAAGAAFMVARNVGISTELFYNVTNWELGSSEGETDQFGLGVGISVFVY